MLRENLSLKSLSLPSSVSFSDMTPWSWERTLLNRPTALWATSSVCCLSLHRPSWPPRSKQVGCHKHQSTPSKFRATLPTQLHKQAGYSMFICKRWWKTIFLSGAVASACRKTISWKQRSTQPLKGQLEGFYCLTAQNECDITAGLTGLLISFADSVIASSAAAFCLSELTFRPKTLEGKDTGDHTF